MKKREVKVGQILFVASNIAFSTSKPSLSNYVVTKVNTRSFYAHPTDGDHIVRFDKRTMRSTSHSFEVHQAYFSEKEYRDLVDLYEKKNSLRKEIIESVKDLELNKLEEITAIIQK
ncbi:beta barrel domain-containing protein [Virgibacillus salexigens]|uniref:Uncharacterized protein n=1 Tax=Virgibacillus massiliensis TaxID=1462526 RepID=A0A024QIZ6_9BACI|nr:hypothetical protein [Virgibacillus massiliensis]CDQ41921.1 hypothetical protein BN990_04300 [Virgibacillus massiliensis]